MVRPQANRMRSARAAVFCLALALFAIVWSVLLTNLVIRTTGLPFVVLAGCAMSVGLALNGAYMACKIVGEIIVGRVSGPGSARP